MPLLRSFYLISKLIHLPPPSQIDYSFNDRETMGRIALQLGPGCPRLKEAGPSLLFLLRRWPRRISPRNYRARPARRYGPSASKPACWSGAAQLMQNFESSLLSAWHLGHFMRPPLIIPWEAEASSSAEAPGTADHRGERFA